MKLQDLFAPGPGISSKAVPALEVTSLQCDTRKVTLGGVFVALKGQAVDGHQFLTEAVRRGALALVVSDVSKVPLEFSGYVLLVEDTRAVMDLLAARFYSDPGKELFAVGVTGTNGKTSTTYLVEAILNAGGLPTGVIGTVNHHLGQKIWPTEMTTPDPLFLQQRLREFREAGAKAVALEVSSHALAQSRADSVPFNVAIFTNLTRDHLDYHKTMKAYFQAKERLFLDLLWKTNKQPSYAVVNLDDAWGRRLHIADTALLWTFGRKQGDFRWKIKTQEYQRTVFTLETPMGPVEIDLPMGGDHNVQNAVGAIAAGLAAGVTLDQIAGALKSFAGVPGRLQSVPNDSGISVFVDYAHSPDALENVLSSLQRMRRAHRSSAEIWTVFGCGGDRDKGKRPLMLQVARHGSDHVVVTSDNPRTEDPKVIVDEIMQGESPNEKLQAIVDRRLAIQTVLASARRGDVVLIAGKGHEDYQILGTEKIHFSDFEEAQNALKGRAR